MNVCYMIYGGKCDEFVEATVRSLRKHSDCRIVLLTPGMTCVEKLDKYDVEVMPVKKSDWENKRAFCKIVYAGILNDSVFQEGDRILAADLDLVFRKDPFEVFEGDWFDFFYTTRHYDYVQPINAGVYGWVVNDRTKNMFKFWVDIVLSPKWEPYVSHRKKMRRQEGNLDWQVGQDFVAALHSVHKNGKDGPGGVRLHDAGPLHNWCLPDCDAWERDGDAFVKGFEEAIGKEDVTTIHFKGQGKYNVPKDIMAGMLERAESNERMDRKSLLIVIDEYGWAFEFFARGWAKYSRHDIEYKRHDQVKQEDVDSADSVFVMSTVLQPHYSGKRLKFPKEKTVCAVRSILAHEMVNPDRFSAVVTNSQRAYDFIRSYHPDAKNLHYVLAAVDGNEFTFSSRMGTKVGWSGNYNHNVKRPHLLRRVAKDYGGVGFKSDWGKEFFNKGRSRGDQLLFLRSLGVYVQMSMSEGMSQALMEAVACGVPVVATPVGDTAKLIPEEWQIPVDPEDKCVKKADELIKRLMEEPGLAQKVAAENRKRFEEGGWCWSSRASEMDDLVDKVLKKKRQSTPDATIIIPCYNHSEVLPRAVRSALAQKDVNVEVIVIDDGSDEPIQERVSPEVRLIRHEENRGLAAARNTGFSEANSEFVIPLDADDELEPDFVRSCLDEEAKTGADVVYTDVMADVGGETLMNFEPREITSKNTIVCTALIRKALWGRIDGYDEFMRDGFEDWEFWIRAVKVNAKFEKSCGFLFRYHNAGNSMLTLTNRKRGDVMAYIRSKHPDIYAIPRATVVIPCYNATETIERAYASVAAQTEKNIELIVVDDGSKDDLVLKFAALRREYPGVISSLIRFPANKGLSAARNAGFNKAKAEWVIPLDADDELEPDFIEKCLQVRDVDVAYPNVTMVENGKERKVDVEIDPETLTERNTIVCTALIRKSLWKKLKGYDEEMRDGFEDWEFWIRAAFKGRASFGRAETRLRWHQDGESMRSTADEWADSARDYVAAKHPDVFPPKVTVVIPVWNQAKYLKRCVSSVSNQTIQAIEVIVVDDGSPDNVKEVFAEIEELHPELNIRLISQENKGLPGARNAGFENARAEWVIPVDADDCLGSNDYLERCLGMVKDGVGVVLTDGLSISGRRTVSVVDVGRIRAENTMHACQMIRKSVWETVGGYKEEFYKGYEDWEFWINCLEHGIEFVKCEGIHLSIDDDHDGRMTPEVQKPEAYFELLGMIQRHHPGFFGKEKKTDNVRPGKRMSGLSVVLSSYNQLKTLKLAIESFYFQEVLPLEIIIADDGSSDGTLEWLDMIADGKMPFDVKYVTRKHSWYRLASINNLAASRTRGSRILFTNGDQVHCPSSVRAHLERKDDEVGGGIFKGIQVNHSGKVDVNMVRNWSKVEELAAAHPSQKTNVGYMGVTDPNHNPIGVWGGNFSVPGSVFDQIGGYDEGYDVGWGGEENDLVRRCAREGCRVVWTNDSVIYHLDHPIRAYAMSQLGSRKYVSG